jgi:hypothetical protein
MNNEENNNNNNNDEYLLTLSWRDEAFIERNGELNINNVLEYFCQSSNPFYDSSSLNEKNIQKKFVNNL